ncbi:MAG: hypothetical protein ACRDST_05140 [Pseudonocardiaceae bacterium]
MAAQDGLARRHLGALGGGEALADRLQEALYVDTVGSPRHYEPVCSTAPPTRP